jgi:hypothetical protein
MFLRFLQAGDFNQEVDDRFCSQRRDGSTAEVFDSSKKPLRENTPKKVSLSLKQAWPFRIVGNDGDVFPNGFIDPLLQALFHRLYK